jgi:hypothetical protein
LAQLDDGLLQGTPPLFPRHCEDEPKISGYGEAEAGRDAASMCVICTSDIVEVDSFLFQVEKYARPDASLARRAGHLFRQLSMVVDDLRNTLDRIAV